LEIVLFTVLYNSIHFIEGKGCDVSTYASGLNPDCNDKGKPFCIRTDQNPFTITPVYECVECLTNCDCKLNQFCSKAPGELGICKKFDHNGKYCRDLSDQQLLNTSYPSDWKCVMFYNDFNGTQRINQKGACFEQKCRYCAYSGGNNGISSCSSTSGIKQARVCIYPGKQASRYGLQWQPPIYYQNPRNVWWAVFFCLLIIIFVIEIITLCITKNGKGKGKAKDNSYNSSHSSEINLGNKHNTNNNHPTISENSGNSSTQKTETPPPYEDATRS